MAAQEQDTAAGPVTLEAGRYRLAQSPDGGMVLGRATGLCETCSTCGCGEQAAPVHIPAMVMQMAKGGVLSRVLGRIGGIPE
jgi:hypothetical protein